MANNWYAVERDADDNDWGTGSYDLDEAKRMAEAMGSEARIAEIEDGNDPISVGLYTRDESGAWRWEP